MIFTPVRFSCARTSDGTLATAPHLLVGGTTGSGKSVCLHSFILSLLMRHKPETLQLALIDPKQVEFAAYAKLPNLYRGEIATEIPQSREMLTELVSEMDARYSSFKVFIIQQAWSFKHRRRPQKGTEYSVHCRVH